MNFNWDQGVAVFGLALPVVKTRARHPGMARVELTLVVVFHQTSRVQS
jgi:hypothetical protein